MSAQIGTMDEVLLELNALRARVAELEAQAASAKELEAQLRQKSVEQTALLDALPMTVFFKTRDHRYTLVNRAYADLCGHSVDQIIGKTDADLYPPEMAQTLRETDEATMSGGAPVRNVELKIRCVDGREVWVTESYVPFRSASGEVVGMVAASLDITDRKEKEEALRRSTADLEEALRRQEQMFETILELSAPVLSIEKGILLLPLVGHIDTSRSSRILEALLAGVQHHGAAFAILDLTGVPIVDTSVAQHLIRAAKAARLLGAQCILVGISPAIAQALVTLDIDLGELVVRGDLLAGVRYALSHRGE
ncbi:MAG TPA: PAS domain-containing protein [Polyangiaceae bacterium]|nr:PAS domain-containing protein [Polyangiaceae bacterium]